MVDLSWIGRPLSSTGNGRFLDKSMWEPGHWQDNYRRDDFGNLPDEQQDPYGKPGFSKLGMLGQGLSTGLGMYLAAKQSRPFASGSAHGNVANIAMQGLQGLFAQRQKGKDQWRNIPPPLGAEPGGIWQENVGTGALSRRGAPSQSGDQWVDVPAPEGGTPGAWQYNKQTGATVRRGGGPLVVNMGPGNTVVAKGYGEQYNAFQQQARDSYGKIADLNRMGQMVTRANTGAAQPTFLALKSLASDLGYNPDSFFSEAGIGKSTFNTELGAQEAMQALTTRMAMELIQDTKGAISNYEMKLFLNAQPGLSRTPLGNMLMISAARTVLNKELEVADMASQYRIDHGQLDVGWDRQMQQWQQDNPLFTEDITEAMNVATYADQTIYMSETNSWRVKIGDQWKEITF